MALGSRPGGRFASSRAWSSSRASARSARALVECVLGTVAECLERLKGSRSSDSSDSNQNRGPTDENDSDSELAVIERSLEFATRYLAAVSRVAPDPEGAGEARELAVANALVAVLSADDEDGGFARWRARASRRSPPR